MAYIFLLHGMAYYDQYLHPTTTKASKILHFPLPLTHSKNFQIWYLNYLCILFYVFIFCILHVFYNNKNLNILNTSSFVLPSDVRGLPPGGTM